MQWFAALLLVATALAGCSTASEVDGFEVAILYDQRSTFYTGDPVDLRADAFGEPVILWKWDFGDGRGAEGQTVQHVYETDGEMRVRVQATRDDGVRAVGEATIAVRDLFGAAPPEPPSIPEAPGGLVLQLAGEEPVAGEPFDLVFHGPSAAGSLSVWVDGQPLEKSFSSLPVTIAIDGLKAGPQNVSWLADLDGETWTGSVSFDVWGQPIEFGAPGSDQWLRPGIQSSVCTTNFLFHYKWYRFFVGSAAHCVDDLELDQVCQAKPTGKIGKKETLAAHDSSRATSDVWVAYESWITMDRVKESSIDVCRGNDFALLELGPDAQQLMHPAALFYGGPTGMAPVGGYGLGTTLYGYGASMLHGNAGVGYPGQEAVNRKVGLSLGTDNGGYSQHLLFALPGVPGDSGGPAFGPDGEALGAASTITLAPTPGTNRYTSIPKALEYMEEHEGWAPELVTYDSWSVTGT